MQGNSKFELLAAVLVDVLRHQEGDEFADKVTALIRSQDPLGDETPNPALLRAVTILLQFANSCQIATLSSAKDARRKLHQNLEKLHKRDPIRFDYMVDAIAIELVLTAHPTEIKRQSVQRIELKVTELTEAHDPNMEALKREVLTLWNTTLSRHNSLTVQDEIVNGVQVLRSAILPALSELAQDPGPFGLQRSLRFASWIGGDRDGNPNVGASTLAFAARKHVDAILTHYLSELAQLVQELSLDDSLVEVPDALRASRAFPG